MSLRAAFGSFEYTPAIGAPLGRMSHHTLVAQDVHSPLEAHLCLFADDAGLVGLLALDQIRMRALETHALRQVMAQALGVAPDRFMVTASHTHNCSALSPWRPSDTGFLMLDRLVAATAALAGRLKSELQPVSLRWARRSAPGLAANRRPIYRAPDGREQVGTHGPTTTPDFLRMEGPDEDELRLLLAYASNGRLLGGLINFPCHPTTMYGEPVFSSDYPGALRRELRQNLGAPLAFVNGFAGDQTPNPAARKGATGPQWCQQMGAALAQHAIAAARDAQPLDPTPGVASLRRRLRIPLRLPAPEQVALAWNHLERVIQGQRPGPLVTPLYGYAFHFHHGNHAIDDWLAREIIGRWEVFRRGEDRHPAEAVEIQTLRIGAMALAGLPGEPFSCFGRQLRAESPIEQLMCAEHANAFAGYIPPLEGFDHGGYECCLADQSRLHPQAGPRLAKATLAMLKQLRRA